MLRELQSIHAGDRLILSLLLVIALAGGAVLGIVLNNWLGWLLHSVSSRLGGHGTVDGVRAAYAWSFVPNVWALVLWIPAIAVFGRGLFTSAVPTPQASAVRSIAYLSFLIIQFIAGAWSLVLLIASVSEVEAMSVWRTIAAMLLAILIISVTLFLIAALMQGLHFVPTSTSG